MKVEDINFAAGTAPDNDHIVKAIRAVDPRFDITVLKGRDGSMALMTYATNSVHAGFRSQEEYPLATEQINKLGAVLVKIEDDYDNAINHPSGGANASLQKPLYELTGSDGVTHKLRAKEFSAYITSGKKAPDGTGLEPVNEWAKRNNYHFTQEAVERTLKLKGGIDQKLSVETPSGSPRVVTNKKTGGQLTQPINGDYTRVTDVGGEGAHAALNAYVAPSAHAVLDSGKVYDGSILAMQQMKTDKKTGRKVADEAKIIFAKDVNEAREVLSSTWDKKSDFVKNNEGTYIELTAPQYQQFKEEFKKEHDHLNVEDFARRTGAKIAQPTLTKEFDGSSAADIKRYQEKLNAYYTLREANNGPKVARLEITGAMDSKTLERSHDFKNDHWVDGNISISYLKHLAKNDDDLKAIEGFSKGFDGPDGAKRFYEQPPQAALEWVQQKLVKMQYINAGEPLEQAIKREKLANWTDGTYTQSVEKTLDNEIIKLQGITLGQQGEKTNDVINMDRLTAMSEQLGRNGSLNPAQRQALLEGMARTQSNGNNAAQNVDRGQTGGLVASTPVMPSNGADLVRVS